MKPKVLIINSVCGFGSTGRIVAELSKSENYDALVCYGRKKDFANVNSYRFANFFDNAFGAIRTILFDNNLNICTRATKKLINKIKEYNPDIIHLHNLHGYYLNIEMLFEFLKQYNKPVLWTLHDIWPMTGYCATSDYMNCYQYQKECTCCKQGFIYPFSLFKQNLKSDFLKKRELFNNINNLVFVTPSLWMENNIKHSFLRDHQTLVVNNGIKLEKFKPTCKKNEKFTVITVANYWTQDRGSLELEKLIPLLDKDIQVIVVGHGSEKYKGVQSIQFTNSVEELVDLYSSSHALINQTLDENFPTVNMEALACGTPVITYQTGGSPEIVDEKTGIVVEKGNVQQMADTINQLKNNYHFQVEDCVNRSKLYDFDYMLKKYQKIYEDMLAL